MMISILLEFLISIVSGVAAMALIANGQWSWAVTPLWLSGLAMGYGLMLVTIEVTDG